MAAKGWFIYALGTGWGHLNRALALARVACQSRPVHLLTNSPYAERLLSTIQTPTLTVHRLRATDSLQDARREILTLLHAVDYDCLVVDTFPRGLLGELVDLIPQQQNICHIWVHRDLKPEYVTAKGLEPFVHQFYQGIVVPGEADVPLGYLPQVYVTQPWLSLNARDLVGPERLRQEWHIAPERPCVIICATGKPQELDLFGQLTEQIAVTFPDVQVRCLAATCPPHCLPERWITHWPGIEVLQLADVVIGSGGYNLVHECQALDIPLIGFALPRKYDRQARRIQIHGGYQAKRVEDAISHLMSLLPTEPSKHQKQRSYPNGADAAVRYIEERMLS